MGCKDEHDGSDWAALLCALSWMEQEVRLALLTGRDVRTSSLTGSLPSRWDDWVPSARVLKHDAAGLARQAELVQEHKAPTLAKTVKAGKAGSPGRAKSSPVPAAAAGERGPKAAAGVAALKGKKRTRENAFDTVRSRGTDGAHRHRGSLPCSHGGQEADYIKRPEVKIPIPDVLKVKLVDDWENVTHLQQVGRRVVRMYGKWLTLSLRPAARSLASHTERQANHGRLQGLHCPDQKVSARRADCNVGRLLPIVFAYRADPPSLAGPKKRSSTRSWRALSSTLTRRSATTCCTRLSGSSTRSR